MFGGKALPDAADFIAPTIDLFRGSREYLVTLLQRSAFAGFFAAQAHKIYAAANPSPEYEWSVGAVKKLEELVRLRGGSFPRHLGAPLPAYLKRVYEPQVHQQNAPASPAAAAAADSAAPSSPLSREAKIAHVLQLGNSRLSAVVVGCVLEAYFFSVELVAAAIVHPVMLHRMALQEEEAKRMSGGNGGRTASAAPASSGPWWQGLASLAVRATLGSGAPPQLMTPPPHLEVRGSVASAASAARAADSGASSSSSSDDDGGDRLRDGGDALMPRAEAGGDDSGAAAAAAARAEQDRRRRDALEASRNEKQRRREERDKLRRASPTSFNEMLLNLVHALKSSVDGSIDAALKSSERVPAERRGQLSVPLDLKQRFLIEEDIIDRALRCAVQDASLYTVAPPNLEWIIDVVYPKHSAGSARSATATARSNAGDQHDDAARELDFLALLNFIVSSGSFRALVQRGAEQLFERVGAPAVRSALQKCKTFDAGAAAVAAATAAVAEPDAAVPTVVVTKTGGSVQMSHMGGALSAAVYDVFDAEVHAHMLPELFGREGEEERALLLHDEVAEDAYLGGRRVPPSPAMLQRQAQRAQTGLPPLTPAEAEEEAQLERDERMYRKATRAARRFPSFPSMTTYGALALQLARATIECTIGCGLSE